MGFKSRMSGLNPNHIALKCHGLQDELYLPHLLGYKFQMKSRMLSINCFTIQSFHAASLYTNSLDSLYSFIIILFSHILFPFLENIVACVMEVW
jgi:hypothetical protein